MKHFLLSLLTILVLTNCSQNKNNIPIKENQYSKRVIAYVNSWEDNWGKNFEKANQITHINYAFANIKDGMVVEGSSSDGETLIKLNKLKSVNKELKILISIGGWSWSKNFSDAALTVNSREVFANSAIAFMQLHKIDGIDLDWEYPGLAGDGNGFRPEDRDNFTALLKLLREKLDSISTQENQYLLTIATGAFQSYLDHTDMKEAHQYLDFINIMTYDFRTGGSKITGHHANLKTSKYDTNSKGVNAIEAVSQHIKAGIPANKIVLGVPFYGRWWKGTNPTNNGLYQPSKGTSGSYNYNVIADSLKSNSGFVSHWDSTAMAPYIWQKKDSMFLTYDNDVSIKMKVDYVNKNKLGGIMFWQFNGDNGTLLNAISENLD